MAFPLRNLAVGAGRRDTGLLAGSWLEGVIGVGVATGRGTRNEALGAGPRSHAERDEGK